MVISYLPKTLRIGRDLPFNNRYALFIENTATVDSIQWSFTLFLNGQLVANPNFILAPFSANEAEYTLFFLNDVIDSNRQPQFDRLRVTCSVTKGANTLELTLEHNLVTLLNATGLPSANVLSGQSAPFSGNLDTTNFILNHLKDYLPAGLLAWNNFPIEIIPAERETLLKIVVAILYNNILVSENISSEFSFLFDINQYANVGIRSFLDLNDPYDGNFTNGLCRLPLHILSDILPAIHQLPDLTRIDEGNGNAIYNIIRDQGLLTYNDLEGDVLRTVPQRIQDSKQRLKNDRGRFVELYNLSMFPKPAIRLTAVLVKYLLACSQLNQCSECKDKDPLWMTLTLEGLKNHPNFLKNILTHYFREPSNKIETYAKDASRTTSFVWDPAVYTILNAPPRIVKAYFAKKVVRQIQDIVGGAEAPVHIFDFERIDSTAIRLDQNGVPINPQPAYDAILGQKVYLIVETLHSRNREITLSIQTGNEHLTGNLNEVLALLSGRNDLSRIPADFRANIQRTVGAFDDLRNNANDDFNSKEREYYQIDHQDQAVVKLRLTGTQLEFTNWANRLGTETAHLKLAVRFFDDTPAFFGSDGSATRTIAEFLSGNDPYQVAQMRVINRHLYEMYQANGDNSWNFLPEVNPDSRRRTGRIVNPYILGIGNNSADLNARQVNYYYFDPLDNEHEFGSFQITRTQRWPTNQTNPNDLISMVVATALVEYDKQGVHIAFRTDNSDRDYIDLGCFSGLLGAMAANNISDLGFNGFSMANGSPGVSSSHINGVAGDLRYLRTDLTGGQCLLNNAAFDFDRQVAFSDSLHDFGWGRNLPMLSERFLRNGVQQLLPHTQHFHRIRVGGVTYDSEDTNPGMDFPQRIVNPVPQGAPLQNGTVITVMNPNQINIGGVVYNVNAQREIIAPLPAGAVLVVGSRVNNPVRHNNHLHVQGFDFTTIVDVI